MKLAGTDFRILRVFDAVVRHGGFAAAQAELNIGQSTISNHITALEQRLGVSLCQRGRSGFRLTEKGELVFHAIQRLMGSLDEFSNDVAALKGQLSGTLKLGIVDGTVTDPNSKTQNAIALFKEHPNNVKIEIHQQSPQELQEKVLSGDIHMGIGSFPHKITGLEYQSLYTEKHSLYCASHHPLSKLTDVEKNIDLLQQEASVTRGYWPDQHQKNLGFENVCAVVYQMEPQLMLILSGKFIGFLPDHYAAKWVKEKKLHCLAAKIIFYDCTFDLILKKGYRNSQLIETFRENLNTVYRQN